MAEDSAFWQGTLIGDAASSVKWQAPYSDIEYADIWSKLLASDDNQGFVVPTLNNLNVKASTPAARNVILDTGAIFIRGRIYENTVANTLDIAVNSSGNPRIDRVVLRINFASQTIRAAILQGTAAAVPSLPALTQTAATYEISLAYVWVANGAATIANTEIHDEREFACTSANFNDQNFMKNLVSNSEFMAFSALNGGATALPPEYWAATNVTDIASVAIPSQMSRGRAISLTASASEGGLTQDISVKPSTTYTIKLLTYVTAGDVGFIKISLNGTGALATSRLTRRTGSWIEEKIFVTTVSDATTMTIQLAANANTDVIRYGQILVVEGWVPGPFRQCSESLMFTQEIITDANWNTTAKSSGTTTITLTVDFQALVLPGTKNIYLIIKANDSGSAAGTPSFIARPFSAGAGNFVSTYLEGVPNDKIRGNQGMIALDSSLRFTLVVTASGAGTCDCFVGIAGIDI